MRDIVGHLAHGRHQRIDARGHIVQPVGQQGHFIAPARQRHARFKSPLHDVTQDCRK